MTITSSPRPPPSGQILDLPVVIILNHGSLHWKFEKNHANTKKNLFAQVI